MSKHWVAPASMVLLLLGGCGTQAEPSSVLSAPATVAVGKEARSTDGTVFYANKADIEATIAATAGGTPAMQSLAADIAADKAHILAEGTPLAVRELSGMYLRAEPLTGELKGMDGWTVISAVTATNNDVSPPARVAPPSTYSVLNIDTAAMEQGKVVVSGTTDLPDGAKINVDFSVIRKNPKTESYVGVSEDVLAHAGKFRAELTPPDHPDLAAGPNEVELLFTPRAQEPNILAFVGEDGEKLSGPSADRSLGFTLLKTSQRVPILLAKKNYPMVMPNAYSRGTPERAVAEYLASWKAKNWTGMLASTQITWRETTDNATKRLQSQYEIKNLLGAEILGSDDAAHAMVDVSVRITYSVGSNVETTEDSFRVIRETGAYEPDADRGTWGVNPSSAM
jgi:hypothetical protein